MAMAGGRLPCLEFALDFLAQRQAGHKGADTPCSHIFRPIIMAERDRPNLSEPVWPSGKALGW